MLYGPLAQGKLDDQDWVLQLPEDDPATLPIILKILHGFLDIPLKIDMEILFWSHHHHRQVRSNPYSETVDDKLAFRCLRVSLKHGPLSIFCCWIAWDLGHTGLFTDAAEAMLGQSKANEKGELVNSRGQRLADSIHLDALDILGMPDINPFIKPAPRY